jgi:hypothetical protein
VRIAGVLMAMGTLLVTLMLSVIAARKSGSLWGPGLRSGATPHHVDWKFASVIH